MSIKRYMAAGFFSLTLAVSAFGYGLSPVMAEDDTDSDPVFHEAEAKNTGGTSAFEAGDSIVLEFSETTNKYEITAANIMDEFDISGDHTFLDGSDSIGSATWSVDGEELTIVLSAGTSLPTVEVGDTITYVGDNIKDLEDNVVTGDAVIEGSFTVVDVEEECEADDSGDDEDSDEDSDTDEDEDSDEDSDEDEVETSVSGSNNRGRGHKEDRDDQLAEEDNDDQDDESEDCDDSDDTSGKYRCGVGLQNGRLYKIAGSPTVYLMAACRLKPFRGIAAFNSRGLKFQDIIELSALPANISISDKPALPAEGTLIKGSDATVFFIGKNGKRKGFTSEKVFLGLGFKFDQVDQISDSDLSTIENDTDLVDDGTTHPDGALVKCGNSPEVFAVIDNLKFPFADASAFNSRGYSFEHVLVVDCGRFAYKTGPPVTE